MVYFEEKRHYGYDKSKGLTELMEHESIEEGIVVMFTLVSLVLPDMTSSKTTQSNNQTVESPTKKFRIKRKIVTEWKPVHWIFLHQIN